MKFTKKNGGFTLVELIVVIAILAILAAIAVPAYSGYIQKANEAGDQQLLAAVNTAYAAACLENNEDMLTIDPVLIPLTGDVGNRKINTAADFPFKADFLTYFGDNVNSAFKTFTGHLYLAPNTGVFAPGSAAYSAAYDTVMNEYTLQIGAVNDSGFAKIGASGLLEQVDGVAGLASSLIEGDGTLTEVVMHPDYLNTLAGTLGMESGEALRKYMEENMTEEEMFDFLANSTVLNVATTMKDSAKYNETETLTMLQNANFGGLGDTLNTDPEKGLAQAALLYGMYTAFNPAGAKELNGVDDLKGLMNNEKFKAYLAEVNDEGSQAQKDYEGYKSALDIVNGAVKDSPETADQILNGTYTDPELVALLGSLIGG